MLYDTDMKIRLNKTPAKNYALFLYIFKILQTPLCLALLKTRNFVYFLNSDIWTELARNSFRTKFNKKSIW